MAQHFLIQVLHHSTQTNTRIPTACSAIARRCLSAAMQKYYADRLTETYPPPGARRKPEPLL